MIELHTNNGYRKLINTSFIVEIAEVSNKHKANCLLILSNYEKVFVAETYSEVKQLVEGVRVDDR